MQKGGGGANGDVPLDGSHFHDWIDYNGVAFSVELLWSHIFRFLGGESSSHLQLANAEMYCRLGEK